MDIIFMLVFKLLYFFVLFPKPRLYFKIFSLFAKYFNHL